MGSRNEFAVTASSPSFRSAPQTWSGGSLELSSLHQISPYIGKLKPKIARDLVSTFSRRGQLVADPFCGSGTIPLEAAVQGRRVFASDDNPYAQVLTRAKLSPPESESRALERLDVLLSRASIRSNLVDLRGVPEWVRAFFHPQTLAEAIAFADECIERKEHFYLACLLGILHHQRPGFLSYPSSHLVPYLRSVKFPRDDFPELYDYRELAPRLRAKVIRALKLHEAYPSVGTVVRKASIANVSLPNECDAIITSPPYMNALDYRRDNRLRLWFVDRSTQNYSPEPTDKSAGLVVMVRNLVTKSIASLRPGGSLVLVVGEAVTRKRVSSHPSSVFAALIDQVGGMRLIDAISDEIPDVRRSRREGRATKVEHILVYRRSGRGRSN